MNTETAPQVTTSVIGKDFDGNDVVATFTKTSHNTQVRFSGVVNPALASAMRPAVTLLKDASGGWYVDSALVPPGFRYEGGWDIPFNAPGLQGKRRLFENREALAAILRNAGYLVEPMVESASLDVPRRSPVSNLVSVAAAATAVTAHSDALGIEGDEQIQLWHLVASLHEFAAAQGLNLADIINDVRGQIMKGEVRLPAALSVIAREGRAA